MSVSSKQNKHSQSGFTMLEVLLTMGLVALVAGMGAPLYQSFQVRNDLDIAATSIVHSLRRAQVLSQSGEGDASWGVYVESGSIVLFQGTDYASRESGWDEIFPMPTSIQPSDLLEVVFDPLSGDPQSTGTTTLTTHTNEVRNITINAKGTVAF